MTSLVIHGDARRLPLADTSIDAIVCDPPYGLEFMGKNWDAPRPYEARIRTRVDNRTNGTAGKSTTRTPEAYVAGAPFQAWCQQWAAEAYRVLKPGGHLLAFGHPRTAHRLVCGIEDAGFEIRDAIAWLYGQGFPKSRDLTSAGSEWASWGTALKPGCESVAVARKPFPATTVVNVATHGTGALNIDGCRIPAGQEYADKCASAAGFASPRNGADYNPWTGVRDDSAHPDGRWPTNVVLEETAAAELDQQNARTTSRSYGPRTGLAGDGWRMTATGAEYNDAGGPSRFFPVFHYEPKAPTWERPSVDGVTHPTVKPLSLMRWLVRLVTPPGGVVLDPFTGSGTTLEAALLEGFHAIGIEQDEQYHPLIRYRIDRARRHLQPGVARLRRQLRRPTADKQDDLFAGLL